MLISRGEKIARVIITIFLIVTALVCALPIMHEIAVSLSHHHYVSMNMVTIWPKGFHLNAYRSLFRRDEFWIATLYGFQRVGLIWILCIIFTMLTAYPLSRSSKKLFGRNVLAWYFFIPMIFNGGLVPTYMVICTLGLLDSLWSLVLPNVMVTFYILLLMNFIRSLPYEMEEAARIDGAGALQTLVHIILPVMVPCLATITVYVTLASWNEWLQPMLYLDTPKRFPLMSYLRMFSHGGGDGPGAGEGALAAQMFAAALPMLAIYPFLQKYFTKGLVLGSVKG